MPNPTNVPTAQIRSRNGAIFANSRITNATSKVLFNFAIDINLSGCYGETGSQSIPCAAVLLVKNKPLKISFLAFPIWQEQAYNIFNNFYYNFQSCQTHKYGFCGFLFFVKLASLLFVILPDVYSYTLKKFQSLWVRSRNAVNITKLLTLQVSVFRQGSTTQTLYFFILIFLH